VVVADVLPVPDRTVENGVRPTEGDRERNVVIAVVSIWRTNRRSDRYRNVGLFDLDVIDGFVGSVPSLTDNVRPSGCTRTCVITAGCRRLRAIVTALSGEPLGEWFCARDFVIVDAEHLCELIGHLARDGRLSDFEEHLDGLRVDERGDDPGASTDGQRPHFSRQALSLGWVVHQERDPKHRPDDTAESRGPARGTENVSVG
jgi:hypothetical protein